MEAAALPVAPSRPAGVLLRAASDERLVARLRAGDDAAFEVLYDRHHRGLLAFCRHMLGSREEAEDVLQHVFLAVHRHVREDDRAIQLKAWLYAVARNRCLSVLRARREAVALDDVSEPSTDGLAIADAVERRQDLQELLGDLAGLPDDQRAALLLSELGDLSHDEIAAALDVRREKVKALVFQARESLMSSRRARETDCREIQAQLATLRGGALRRTTLRRHVAVCPSCAAFKAEVKRQKTALALVLPVVPSAVLKKGILASLLGGGGGGGAAIVAGGAATAGGTGLLGTGLLTKGLAVAALAGGAGAAGVVGVRHLTHHPASADAAANAPRLATAAGRRSDDQAAGGAGGLIPAWSITTPIGGAGASSVEDDGGLGFDQGRGGGHGRAAHTGKATLRDAAGRRGRAKSHAHGRNAAGSRRGGGERHKHGRDPAGAARGGFQARAHGRAAGPGAGRDRRAGQTHGALGTRSSSGRRATRAHGTSTPQTQRSSKAGRGAKTQGPGHTTPAAAKDDKGGSPSSDPAAGDSPSPSRPRR